MFVSGFMCQTELTPMDLDPPKPNPVGLPPPNPFPPLFHKPYCTREEENIQVSVCELLT